MNLLKPFYKYGSPAYFFAWSKKIAPWLAISCGLLFTAGLIGGLIIAPPDYQQGESVRIIYVHVPSAWMSLFVYVVMATAGACSLIWHVKMGDVIARATAPLGAWFTFLALATGSLWGKPMWGAYWVWDARLTSELILLFLYLGYISLQSAIDDPRTAARAGAILALVGSVNIPIVHYSVIWWNTLHQGPTVSKFDAPSIDLSMLIPLLIMTVAFMVYFAYAVLIRARCEILLLERNTRWVQDEIAGRSAGGS